MTRKEAKEWLPIIQAWAEGKPIQYQISPKSWWTDINKDLYTSNPPSNYRIKPEPKYRPFKNQEECWQEMHNHPNFGWIIRIDIGAYTQIPVVFSYCIAFGNVKYNYKEALEYYTFTDGTPFGIEAKE